MKILLKEVRIKNFRSLEKVSVKLNPITLLVGQNNAGKTSFLKALQLVFGTSRKIVTKEDIYVSPDETLPLDRISTIDTLLIPTDLENNRINEFSDFWGERFGEAVQLTDTDHEYVAIRTLIEFNELKGEYVILQNFLKNWNDNPEVDINTEDIDRKVSRRILEKTPLFFMDAQRDIQMDLQNPSSYWGRLASDIGLEPEIVEELEKSLNAVNSKIVDESEVLSHMTEVLEQLNQYTSSGDSGIQISPITRKIRDLSRGMDILFKDHGSESFPISFHGMGTRSWATLLTFQSYISWISKKNKKENEEFFPILALEEPEAHLHPQAQRNIYNQISKFEGQRIISTHSPYILGLADLKSIRHFYKLSSVTRVKEINLEGVDTEGERKIKREVLNTRGEILFSKAIILSEGETEEQALQIFAQEYWGSHPYELGISFIGVGGARKYLPFIRLAQLLEVKWFIFSDGEEQPLQDVNAALTSIGKRMEDSNIIILEDGLDFEKYILSDYETEISEMLITEQCKVATNQQHAESIKSKGIDKERALRELKNGKTKYGPLVAEKLIGLADKEKRIPWKIENLFTEVSSALNIERKGD